jgi:hypothetical protein
MVTKKSKKQRYNFLINRDIYDDFSIICEELGLVRSKKLELYMREFILHNQDLLNKLKDKE